MMKRPPAWALYGSLIAHVALLGGAVHFATKRVSTLRLHRVPSLVRLQNIELPIMLSEEASDEPVTAAVPVRAAGAQIARIDTGERGRGGESTSRDEAVHLAAQIEAQSFNQDLLNSFQSQVTRVNSHQTQHVSNEDDRATPKPMELTFVARGDGDARELRKNGASASQGLLQAFQASHRGEHGASQEREQPPEHAGDEVAQTEDSRRAGSEFARPQAGTWTANALRNPQQTAPVQSARPDVKQGAASVPAAVAGRTHDTTDSDQRVADAVRTIVQSSTFGGAKGEGAGGVAGEGAAGAGGVSGEGAHPTQLGQGGVYDLDSRDPNFSAYFQSIKQRIDPLVQQAIPREAILDLKQGYLILELVIAKNGTTTVVWPPIRPSGVEGFDSNCRDLVRKLGAFAPIPEQMGKDSLRVRAKLRFTQPL
jgi:hypothetical protein